MTPSRSAGKWTRRIGFLIITCAILVRTAGILSITLSPRGVADSLCVQPDTRSYMELSEDLRDGIQDSASKRMPLYPLLLLFCGTISGEESRPGVILIQQILDVMTALLIGAIAARFSRSAFLPAVGLGLMIPALVIHSFMLLPESLMVTICAATGYLWIRLWQSDSPRTRTALIMCIGVLLSLGVAVKPVMALAWIPYASLIVLGRNFPLKQKLVLLPVLFVFSASFGWAWRHHNNEQFGLDALSTQMDRDPFERVLILSGEVSWDTAERDSLVNIISAPSLTEDGYDWGMRDSIFNSIMWTQIRKHPLRIAVPHLISWPGFFKPGTKYLEELPLFSETPLLFIIASGLATALAVSLLFLYGTSLIVRRFRSRASPLVGMTTAWFILSIVVSGPAARAPKYGLTFFWAFAAVAAVTLTWLIEDRPGKSGTRRQ